MYILILKSILLLLFIPNTIWADSKNSFDHSHSAWDKILKEYLKVSGATSRVNYSKLKANVVKLDAYLSQVEEVSKPQYQKFSSDEKLAFLINAYNAFTLKLITNHYPVDSIKDIGGLFSSPWKQEFFTLLGKKSHLDNIEHNIIRKEFNEPRIHFALVCAAKGCPPLRSEAYLAAKLEEQLEDAGLSFINDRSRNFYDSKPDILHVSSIFKWYGDDFNKNYGSFINYVSTRIKTDPKPLSNKKPTIKYLDYDWSLNEK